MFSKTEQKRILAELKKVRIGVDLTPPEFEKKFDFLVRQEYIEKYGFPLVGDGFNELVDVLQGSKVLGVCSGLAYYERLLRDVGVDIIATDTTPPPKTWMPVEQLNLYVAISKYQDRDTVFCSWPYPGTFIWAFQPHVKRVILIGECYEGGCCDSMSLEPYTRKPRLVKMIDIPQWECVHDRIYVYEF